MRYDSISACDDFSPLIGQRVDAWFHADGYWHFFVALRAQDGQSIVLTTEDNGLAMYFEVFSLKFAFEASEEREWTPVEPLLIESVRPLWRLEWLEPTAGNGQYLGSGPHHVHHAGAGPASPAAVHVARVLAGVALADAAGRVMIVSASAIAPFNVDITIEPAEVALMLDEFQSA